MTMKVRAVITLFFVFLSIIIFSSCEDKIEKPQEEIRHENIIYKIIDDESVAISSVEEKEKTDWNCSIAEKIENYTVRVVEDDAFSYCTGLLSLELPSSITKIGKNIVSGAESLEKITILSDSFTLSDNTFSGATKLKDVYIENISKTEGRI